MWDSPRLLGCSSSQQTLFFSHTTLAAASSTSTANGVIVSYRDLIFLALLHCMDMYMYAMLTFIFLVGAICFVISIGHIYLGVFCITDRDRGWDIEVLLTMSKETSCTAIYALGFLFPTTIDCWGEVLLCIVLQTIWTLLEVAWILRESSSSPKRILFFISKRTN